MLLTFPELHEGMRDLPVKAPPFISWFWRNRIVIESHGIGCLNHQGYFMNQRHQFLLILCKSLDKYYFIRTLNTQVWD